MRVDPSHSVQPNSTVPRSPFPPVPIISPLSLSLPLLDNSKKKKNRRRSFFTSSGEEGARSTRTQSWDQSYRLIARQFQSRPQSLFPINPCLRRRDEPGTDGVLLDFFNGRKLKKNKRERRKKKRRKKSSNLSEKVGHLLAVRPRLAAPGM